MKERKEMSTETFELKSFNSPDAVRKFDKGEIDLVNVAGAAIGRATFEPRLEMVYMRKADRQNERLQNRPISAVSSRGR